jgi:hypothetical protein
LFEDFAPPEKGLNPGEEVVWSQRAGMAALWMFGGGCCLVFSPWILLIAYGWFGSLIANGLLVVILIGLFLSILEFVNSRRTKYYLTTKRIVEARGGLVKSQMPLEAFQGVDVDEYIEIKSGYSEGSKTFYQVKIRNPASGKLMVLTGLDEDATDVIRNIAG